MLEAGTVVRAARVWVSAGVGAALLASAPWVGWWPLVFSLLSAAQVASLDHRVARSVRPERFVAASFAFTAIAATAGVVTSGGPDSPLLPLLALPATLMANRFRRAVVVAGAGFSLVLMLLGTVVLDPRAFADDPSLVFVSLAMLLGVVVFTLSLSDTEQALRADARFDHLTGLLNRAALAPRFAELRSQARATDGPIALVVYDLDNFKAVNDDLGHDRGDAVLRDAAAQLRRHLRAFDLAYRLGGEEFALVLPGVGVAEAEDIAQRQREAIEEARPGGVTMTISGGVASARGSAVDWDTLFQRADAALLRAKREGRNRIVIAADEAPALPPAVAPDAPPAASPRH
jgi:diguanylate cyclase (GGDEF)-like protein